MSVVAIILARASRKEWSDTGYQRHSTSALGRRNRRVSYSATATFYSVPESSCNGGRSISSSMFIQYEAKLPWAYSVSEKP